MFTLILTERVVEKRFCSHQSLCHGGLILPREMLLQGQDNTVGSDGGQDHVLKWCKGHKVKESAFITGTKLTCERKQVMLSKYRKTTKDR